MNVGAPNTNPGTQIHHWGLTSQYHTERQCFTNSLWLYRLIWACVTGDRACRYLRHLILSPPTHILVCRGCLTKYYVLCGLKNSLYSQRFGDWAVQGQGVGFCWALSWLVDVCLHAVFSHGEERKSKSSLVCLIRTLILLDGSGLHPPLWFYFILITFLSQI